MIGLASPLLSLDGGAFAGDEDGAGRRDIEFFRIAALVEGDANASARVDVEQGIADRDVHESFDVGQGHGFLVDLEHNPVASVVTELFEVIPGNIGNERAVGIVESNNVTVDAFFGGYRSFRSQTNELGNDGADQIEIPSGGEVGGGGSKNVAAVKGGRDGRLDHPVGIGDLARGIKPVAVNHRCDESIVGENEILALFGFYDDGFARSADAGIDDDQENRAGRIVRGHTGQESRTFFDGVGCHLMSDVHDAGFRRNANDHRPATGRCVISRAKVGHKDDGGTRNNLHRRLGARRAEQGKREQRHEEYTSPRNHSISLIS